MDRFTIEMPRAIHVGPGALDQLPAILGEARRVLLVSGERWLASSPWDEAVSRLLQGRVVSRFACPRGEPTTGSVSRALEQTRPFGADALVAIGGGSVLDTTKALSALLVHGGPVERYLEGVQDSVAVPGPGIPWIAVPTTAGTGAEVTKNAVIRAPAIGVKRSMRSAHLLAIAVIADPRLTVSLPLADTGICGLDALVQLIEAYVSRGTSPFVRAIVRSAFAPMVRALRGLPGALEDLELRSSASWGALVSGIALANAGLGAAHGFAAGIGGMYEVPHGLLCAVFMPAVLEANAPAIGEGIAELVREAGGDAESPVTWLAAEMRSLLDRFGLPRDLTSYAIPRSMAGELAERSAGSSMRGNPRELSAGERRAIVSSVL